MLLRWLGRSGFAVRLGKVALAIDPLEPPPLDRPPDAVLITHEHCGHLNLRIVEALLGPETLVLAPHRAAEVLSRVAGDRLVAVAPGSVVEIRGVAVWAVPAYNVSKLAPDGLPYHPREALYVGYVVEPEGGPVLYHAGDTDKIPEMRGIMCDIALLPAGGATVMTPEEAAEAARLVGARVVVPMHVEEPGAVAARLREALGAEGAGVVAPDRSRWVEL